MKKLKTQMSEQDDFEKRLNDKQESRRIKLDVMSELGMKLKPFSDEELALLEKVEAGIATKEEEFKAKKCYEAHEAEASVQAAMVEAFLFQCKSSGTPQLMIH